MRKVSDAEVREWALGAGVSVSTHGRLPNAVREQLPSTSSSTGKSVNHPDQEDHRTGNQHELERAGDVALEQ